MERALDAASDGITTFLWSGLLRTVEPTALGCKMVDPTTVAAPLLSGLDCKMVEPTTVAAPLLDIKHGVWVDALIATVCVFFECGRWNNFRLHVHPFADHGSTQAHSGIEVLSLMNERAVCLLLTGTQ